MNKKHWKLTRHAFNCKPEITQFRDSSNKDEKVYLVWNGERLPVNCRYPSSLPNPSDLRSKIPFCYMRELIHETSNTTILAGGERDMILGCTFSDFDSLYLVSRKALGEEDLISIPFNELYKYEFLLQFNAEKTNKDKRFRLNATSWNNVKLTWV